MLLGLIVVHVMASRSAFKYLLLGAVYLGIFMFGWVALVVAFVGIGDPVMKFRERALGSGPPAPPDND